MLLLWRVVRVVGRSYVSRNVMKHWIHSLILFVIVGQVTGHTIDIVDTHANSSAGGMLEQMDLDIDGTIETYGVIYSFSVGTNGLLTNSWTYSPDNGYTPIFEVRVRSNNSGSTANVGGNGVWLWVDDTNILEYRYQSPSYGVSGMVTNWTEFARIGVNELAQGVPAPAPDSPIYQYTNPYDEEMLLVGFEEDGTARIYHLQPGESAFIDHSLFPEMEWYTLDAKVTWNDINGNGIPEGTEEMAGWWTNNVPLADAVGTEIYQMPAGTTQYEETVTPAGTYQDLTNPTHVQTIEINNVTYYKDEYGSFVGYLDEQGEYRSIVPQNPTLPDISLDTSDLETAIDDNSLALISIQDEVKDVEDDVEAVNSSVQQVDASIQQVDNSIGQVDQSIEDLEQTNTDGFGQVVAGIETLDDNQQIRHDALRAEVEILNTNLDTADPARNVGATILGIEDQLIELNETLNPDEEDLDQAASGWVNEASSIAQGAQTSFEAAASTVVGSNTATYSAPDGALMTWPVVTLPILGTIDFDPFARFTWLASFADWLNTLIKWAVSAAFLLWFWSQLDEAVQSIGQTPVQTTSGGGLTGLIAVGKQLGIAALFVSIGITAIVAFLTLMKGFALPVIGIANSVLNLSGGPVSTGMNFIALFIPVDHIISLFLLRITVKQAQIPAIVGIQSLIRLITV